MRTTHVFVLILLMIVPAVAQVPNYEPVTDEMLQNPSPDDWLMFSRTYDNQRFSPLDQINRQNVGQLRMVWARGMGAGIHENIPLVHQGVMYVATPGAVIQALDATNGDLKYVRASDPSGASWGVPVTPDSTGDVGLYTSLAVVNGNAAISYYYSTNRHLKYVLIIE